MDLSCAWSHFGDERQLQQQAERHGTPYSLVIQQLMMGDLFGMLASNKLVAMGYRIAPNLSDGPIPIPNDVFEERQADQWQSDKASASGYSYERVKVLQPHALVGETPRSATPDPEASPEPVPALAERSMYGMCKRVFDALNAENESYISLSPELLLERFQIRYTEMHGEAAKLKPSPQVRTLRTHLTRYRKELQQVSASSSNLPNNSK